MKNVIRMMAVLWCALSCLPSGQARAEKRVALVIGNGSYAHIAALPNVRNDTSAMAALFKAANFDAVDVKHDLSVAELRRALKEFAGRAADADVAVLFYAGHGIEVGQANYLIPVDARLVTDFDVEDETVPLDRVLQAMEPAKRLRLVILDACRENPFAKSMKRTVAARSVGRGLGRIEPSTTNTLIAYATKPNAIAEDGKGPNSPFTAALVKHLLTPGLDLRIALGHVRDEVLTSTGKKQEPYVTGSLGGGIVSIATDAPKPSTHVVLTPPVPTPVAPGDAARAWAAAKDSTSIAVLEAFRRQYGASNAFYDRLAEARMEELRKQQVAVLKAEQDRKRAEGEKKRETADLLRLGRVFRDCPEICPEMVVAPAGEFMMGSPDSEPGRISHDGLPGREGPQHLVRIARPFAVGRFAVTFSEWDACVTGGGCNGHTPSDDGWGRDRRPVVNVSWQDANAYLAWLSARTGKAYRLLSSAEREYVARAGTTTPFWWGSSISTAQANYDGSQTYANGSKGEFRQKTVPVNSFRPNPWGLYQVHGNVWEWTQDCYNASYRGAPTDGQGWMTGDCNHRVLRGGSWQSAPERLRSAHRATNHPDGRDNLVGFRVARALAE